MLKLQTKKSNIRKLPLIVIIGILSLNLNAQEIHSEYKFKKEKKKSMWNYIELDSLVLYKNGTFYRNKFYHYHQINYSEYKGNWKIKNGILLLEITKKNTNKTNKNWREEKGIYKYLIKRKKIIPFDGFEFYSDKKLKRKKTKNGC